MWLVPTLFVDMDDTLCVAWPRVVRNSIGGCLRETAFSLAELMNDSVVPKAKEAVKRFQACAWSVAVLTARGFPGGEEVTRAWLERNGFGKLAVIVVSRAEHKSLVLQLRSEPGDLFVDDFMSGHESGIPKFVCHVYESCRKVIMTEVFRNNWPEIVWRRLGRTIDA